MNGAATISPVWTPNYCTCGHDLVMHSLTGQGTCSGCVGLGASKNVHLFTADNEPWPSTRFPASDIPRFVVAGAQNQPAFNASLGANAANSTTVLFTTTAGMKAGMTFYVIQPATPQQNESYTITQIINTTSVLIALPGLAFATTSGQVAVVSPSLGGGMSGGQPNNGQRAG